MNNSGSQLLTSAPGFNFGVFRAPWAACRGLDILVSNAAISVAGTVDDPDADTAALDRMHATNYLGVIAVIRAASRVLRTGGRIITVSSGVGSRAGVP